MQRGGQVTGDPGHAPRVGAVGLHGDVEDRVGPIPSASTRRAPGVNAAGCSAVVASPPAVPARGTMRMPSWSSVNPSSRPEHSIPLETTPFILRRLISKPPGEHRPDRGEGDDVAFVEVPGPAHHLDRLAARLDHDPADAIGAGDGADLEHTGQDDVAEALPHVLDLLDDEAEVVEGRRQVGGVALEGGEVRQPRQRDAHR